jgi:Zn-dependent peptidase ImmA (M78 family)
MHPPSYALDRLLEIEARARSLQIEVYRRRGVLWNGSPPQSVVDILEPGVALHYLGYFVDSVAAIGELEINGVRSEVAGMIDHDRLRVTISERFLNPEKRFTTAHELGHALLHPDRGTMHRDLPMERAGVLRDWREVEANRFASAYLMPQKLVAERFSECFQLDKFSLSDATAYALCGTDATTVRQQYRSPRQLAQCLAGTGRFNFQHFQPLNEQFKVSRTAMAIRLEELGLVQYQ